MLSLHDVPAVIKENITTPPPVFFHPQDALGLVSAGDTRAPADIPPFSVAQVDGWAVFAHNLSRGATTLKVAGWSSPKQPYFQSVSSGHCLAVSVGARIPSGPNCVIPADISDIQVGEELKLEGPVSKGENITPLGSTVKRGALLMIQGTVITPQRIAAAIAAGVIEVAVFPPPGVAVMVTGRGLVEPGKPRKEDESYNFYWRMMERRLCEMNVREVEYIGLIPPEIPRWEKALDKASKADVLIIIGGRSPSDREPFTKLLTDRGAEVLFDGVECSPGGDILCAKKEKGAVFLQIGRSFLNLLSAQGEFVEPIIGRMMGLPATSPTIVKARLAKPQPLPPGEGPRFVLGRLVYRKGKPKVLPFEYGSYDDISAGSKAFGAFLVEGVEEKLDKDTEVEFRLWREIL